MPEYNHSSPKDDLLPIVATILIGIGAYLAFLDFQVKPEPSKPVPVVPTPPEPPYREPARPTPRPRPCPGPGPCPNAYESCPIHFNP